jgi:2-C-methyl-D-erythritol 2,4-cyclodiphosphate synthase
VRFEWHQGLEGHSDADVVLHAVVDALLGAAGLGDIGQHYPNTDPRWKNASSLIFLGETGTALKEAGWQILNIDISVVAEQPKILHRRNDICSMIAKHLDMEASRVNLKATTNEKLGAIGRSEGIAAFAIATLKKTKYKGIID